MTRIRRRLLLLFLVSCTVRVLAARAIPRPGYMDTAYYSAGAIRLAQGGGLTEPFIWNYLQDHGGLVHPGYLYWMPLPALIAAPFASLFPGSFFALQIPFAILSALIPPVTYALARQITKNRWLPWTAGLLSLFSGFFFPYWSLPETFAPFALFGSLALWMAGRPASGERTEGPDWGQWVSVGLLVGLAHLTRADGILILPVVALASVVPIPGGASSGSDHAGRDGGAETRLTTLGTPAKKLLAIGVGYLLVMGPWFGRNLVITGAPLSPAGTKTVWLTKYDDLFCYECELSPSSYLAWGWPAILRSKLSALWVNFQRFLAEDCLVFLLPFALIGLYRLRRRLPFVLASIYLVVVYLAHSLIFTFPGWRGGFFHASSAGLPFLYAAGICGLDTAVGWAASRRRGWRYQEASLFFSAAAVAAAIGRIGYLAWEKIPYGLTA